MALGSLRKQAEQDMGSKSASSIPLEFLSLRPSVDFNLGYVSRINSLSLKWLLVVMFHPSNSNPDRLKKMTSEGNYFSGVIFQWQGQNGMGPEGCELCFTRAQGARSPLRSTQNLVRAEITKPFPQTQALCHLKIYSMHVTRTHQYTQETLLHENIY